MHTSAYDWRMDRVEWNNEKNEQLKRERGVSFEEVIHALSAGLLLDVVQHPNQEKYPNQLIYVVNINNYVYLVPYVSTGEYIFLKTIIPSRKATRDYLRRKPR